MNERQFEEIHEEFLKLREHWDKRLDKIDSMLSVLHNLVHHLNSAVEMMKRINYVEQEIIKMGGTIIRE